MKAAANITVVTMGIVLIALVWVVYALFHGSFDRGSFETMQTVQLAPSRYAFVAKRSDHQALSGDQYFVVIGDHLLSSAGLKHAYYHNGLIFRAGSSCLNIQPVNEYELAVSCVNSSIQAEQIAVEKTHFGNVKILYEGIPNVAPK